MASEEALSVMNSMNDLDQERKKGDHFIGREPVGRCRDSRAAPPA